jgi:hypothetical protein
MKKRPCNVIEWDIPHAAVNLGYQWVLQKGNNSIYQRKKLFILLNVAI